MTRRVSQMMFLLVALLPFGIASAKPGAAKPGPRPAHSAAPPVAREVAKVARLSVLVSKNEAPFDRYGDSPLVPGWSVRMPPGKALGLSPWLSVSSGKTEPRTFWVAGVGPNHLPWVDLKAVRQMLSDIRITTSSKHR